MWVERYYVYINLKSVLHGWNEETYRIVMNWVIQKCFPLYQEAFGNSIKINPI